MRPTACYQKQHDDNTFVHWRSHTPSILRLLHRCRGRGHRLPRNHLLLGMFLLHQAAGTADTRGWVAARQGTHVKTSHASHAELAGSEEGGLGMPALKPPEACSPMLHPMLPMPELRGLGMPALIQPAVCPPSLVPLISCLISRIGICHHSTQSLHSRFLTREHYLWAWDSTFDSVTFLLPGGGHANVGGSI